MHFASFPLFVLTTLHLLTAGTDSGNSLLQAAVIAVIAAVGALTTMRVLAEHTGVAEREAARLRVHAQTVGAVAHGDAGS